MNALNAYSSSGYQLRKGVSGITHVEYEQCPPFAWVMLVFACAMLGGVWFSHAFDSVAAGSIAWVAILAMFGVFVDHRFSGGAALERRIRQRQKARFNALCGISPAGGFGRTNQAAIA